MRYLKNAGWLLAPILLWNAALSSRLPNAFAPEVFMSDMPRGVLAAENMLRIAVFALPFLAPLERTTTVQRVGGIVFGVGMALYFLSWLPLILAPVSPWSTSAIGFLAPAYTPGGWLLGLALLMQRLHWPSPFRWWHYLVLSMAFLGAHISHVAIVFARTSA